LFIVFDENGGRHPPRSTTAIFRPRRLCRRRSNPAGTRYLPTPDGRRFLTVAPLGCEAMTPTTVVLNWFAELGR
jgi:hypothetical protein